MTTPGEFISRDHWGARTPARRTRIPGPVDGIAMHYEGPHMGDYSAGQAFDLIKSIERYHRDTKGWDDIAYSDVVDRFGRIFEGRGPGVRTAAQGTNDGNARYYAICFLMGTDDSLTDEMMVGFLTARQRYIDGGAGREIRPHKFFHATACPGVPASDWVLKGCPTPGSGWVSPPPGPVILGAGAPKAVQVPDSDDDWLEALMSALQTLDLRNAESVPVHHFLVDNLQGLLVGTQNTNWNPGAIDGVAGRRTLAAVRAFQEGKGLAVDGIVGKDTWTALVTH